MHRSLLMVSSLIALAVPSALHAAEQARPNIICIVVDQLRYQACGYAGEWKARTPNLDKLAAAGVNFRQAVSSTPVCAAFRASLLTGKYTSSTGMVINELRMNTHHTSLAQCLTRAGYQTGFIGKWHLYANQLGNHLDPKNSFVPRGPDRLGFDGYWAAYNFHDGYYNAYYHMESPQKIFYGPGIYEPDAQTAMAIDYLTAARKRKQPFFLCLSMAAPHPPWRKDNVPPEYYALFKNVEFPPPKNYSEKLDPYGDAWSNKGWPKDLEERAERMRVYYAMIANIDWNLGRLLAAVDKAGIRRQTVILFTADHGEMLGAHGRMMKNIFYEEAVRVPFFVCWPGTIPAGTVSDACLGSADIMPTLLGLAGVQIPKEVEGVDLSRSALGKPAAEPPFAFLMNTGACAAWENGHEWRALRTKRYTYAVYRGWPEKHLPRKELLFDNVADPYQMKNLADDPGDASLLDDFRRQLQDKMASLGDTFPESTWYRQHWIENRIIKRTATLRE
jgi:arylsulfatase A-like enzyme